MKISITIRKSVDTSPGTQLALYVPPGSVSCQKIQGQASYLLYQVFSGYDMSLIDAVSCLQ